MGSNLTIESPNFEKITKEAGEWTSNGINTLWAALNDTRKSERMDFRRAKDILAPKVLTLSPNASTDNLDLQGCSVVYFTGSTAQNFTGIKAPDTGESRVVIVYIGGSGTITLKHSVTSETANQFDLSGAADQAKATRGAAIFAYLGSKWRQIV